VKIKKTFINPERKIGKSPSIPAASEPEWKIKSSTKASQITETSQSGVHCGHNDLIHIIGREGIFFVLYYVISETMHVNLAARKGRSPFSKSGKQCFNCRKSTDVFGYDPLLEHLCKSET
jgi:hypothetical protein